MAVMRRTPRSINALRDSVEEEDIVDDIMDEIRERAKGSIKRQIYQRFGVYRYKNHFENSTYILDEELSEDALEHLFKVIIIGDATVGKTSFVQRYVQDSFKREYKSTVGVDFALKVLKWSDSDTIKLQLWDIAGQDRVSWMTRVYYKGAQGCIIMFDLSNRNSFLNTLRWKKDLEAKCCGVDGKPIPCVLLANKCDLGHRQVDQLEIEKTYQEHDFIGWTETSVKENLMIADSVRFLVDVMMQQKIHTDRGLNHASSNVQLNSRDKNKTKEKKKCLC